MPVREKAYSQAEAGFGCGKERGCETCLHRDGTDCRIIDIEDALTAEALSKQVGCKFQVAQERSSPRWACCRRKAVATES